MLAVIRGQKVTARKQLERYYQEWPSVVGGMGREGLEGRGVVVIGHMGLTLLVPV